MCLFFGGGSSLKAPGDLSVAVLICAGLPPATCLSSRTHTRTHAHTHTRTHAHTHARAQEEQRVKLAYVGSARSIISVHTGGISASALMSSPMASAVAGSESASGQQHMSCGIWHWLLLMQ